jgi:hypothetical protein
MVTPTQLLPQFLELRDVIHQFFRQRADDVQTNFHSQERIAERIEELNQRGNAIMQIISDELQEWIIFARSHGGE